MIEEEKIIGFIQKKLEGTLASEEAAQLNKWLALPENAVAYEQYAQMWQGLSSLEDKKLAYNPNSEQAWNLIKDEIEAKQQKPRFKLAYAAAASVALLVLVFGVNYFFNAANSADTIKLVLQSNEKDTLTFSDGSMAYLVGPCAITYPKEFAANERNVSMEGFAYFDIEHESTRSFEISTEYGTVEVLGTSFTVDTRQENLFTVQCITGKVRVTGNELGAEAQSILTRKKKATYTYGASSIAVTSFALENAGIEIPARKMTFTNQPLGEILEQIEYSYDVSIKLENKDLLESKYSTTLHDSTLDDFLNELKITFDVDVTQTEASSYILKGGNSN